MAIKTGRYGQVKYSPDGVAAAVEIISINAWTASFKTEYEDVSCFGDENRVYIPGLRDSKGSAGRFLELGRTDAVRGGDCDRAGRVGTRAEQFANRVLLVRPGLHGRRG